MFSGRRNDTPWQQSMEVIMSATERQIVDSLLASFKNALQRQEPYRHWFVRDCLPQTTVNEILNLPLAAADLDGVSGKRELHNATRRYFDTGNRASFTCVDAVAEAFQDLSLIHISEPTRR